MKFRGKMTDVYYDTIHNIIRISTEEKRKIKRGVMERIEHYYTIDYNKFNQYITEGLKNE